eukprot:13836585-Alexandrium_andersonii.AAC.1
MQHAHVPWWSAQPGWPKEAGAQRCTGPPAAPARACVCHHLFSSQPVEVRLRSRRLRDDSMLIVRAALSCLWKGKGRVGGPGHHFRHSGPVQQHDRKRREGRDT